MSKFVRQLSGNTTADFVKTELGPTVSSISGLDRVLFDPDTLNMNNVL